MNELTRLIHEQKKDDKTTRVSGVIENETLIRPHLYRFLDFAGESPKEKAYSILRYLGWNNYDIVSALDLSIEKIIEMQSVLHTTYKPENYKKFFLEIPIVTPKRKRESNIPDNKRKALVILKGLWWTNKDVCAAINVSRRTYCRMTQHVKFQPRSSATASYGKRSYNLPRTPF